MWVKDWYCKEENFFHNQLQIFSAAVEAIRAKKVFPVKNKTVATTTSAATTTTTATARDEGLD